MLALFQNIQPFPEPKNKVSTEVTTGSSLPLSSFSFSSSLHENDDMQPLDFSTRRETSSPPLPRSPRTPPSFSYKFPSPGKSSPPHLNSVNAATQNLFSFLQSSHQNHGFGMSNAAAGYGLGMGSPAFVDRNRHDYNMGYLGMDSIINPPVPPQLPTLQAAFLAAQLQSNSLLFPALNTFAASQRVSPDLEISCKQNTSAPSPQLFNGLGFPLSTSNNNPLALPRVPPAIPGPDTLKQYDGLALHEESEREYAIFKAQMLETASKARRSHPCKSESSPPDNNNTEENKDLNTENSEEAKKFRCNTDPTKDESYWLKRKKNNEAAKKSRDLRRMKEDETAIRAAFLEQENIKLRCELASLKRNGYRVRCLYMPS